MLDPSAVLQRHCNCNFAVLGWCGRTTVSRSTLLYSCTAFLQLLLFKEHGKMLVSFQQIKEVHTTGCSLNIVFYGKF